MREKVNKYINHIATKKHKQVFFLRELGVKLLPQMPHPNYKKRGNKTVDISRLNSYPCSCVVLPPCFEEN